VFTSILKTKHSAVLVTSERDLHYVPSHQSKRKLLLYDLRAHNIDRLRCRLGTYPWEILYDYSSIEQMYDAFVNIVLRIVHAKCIPTKTIVLGPKDPEFITPLVKVLLKQRYRLRRQGLTSRANIIAQKINALISRNGSKI